MQGNHLVGYAFSGIRKAKECSNGSKIWCGRRKTVGSDVKLLPSLEVGGKPYLNLENPFHAFLLLLHIACTWSQYQQWLKEEEEFNSLIYIIVYFIYSLNYCFWNQIINIEVYIVQRKRREIFWQMFCMALAWYLLGIFELPQLMGRQRKFESYIYNYIYTLYVSISQTCTNYGCELVDGRERDACCMLGLWVVLVWSEGKESRKRRLKKKNASLREGFSHLLVTPLG